MTQTREFDFHASIERLAALEPKCPDAHNLTRHSLVKPDGVRRMYTANNPCGFCHDTGHVVPFVSLRVPCVSGWHNYPKEGTQYPPCLRCEDNRGWVPEPDVEKACSRVWEWIWSLPLMEREDMICLVRRGIDLEHLPVKEAVLRAAEAWLGEKP